jgi:beta-galactosidase GanA
VNIVATYCLWSLHEEFEGELSWEGNLNLRRFIEICKELGMKVHLRLGPYCNADAFIFSSASRQYLESMRL